MKFKAISRFTWRDHSYEIGEDVICPDQIIANRMIHEGHISPELAAVKSETVTPASVGAEIPVSAPVANPQKKVSKKTKR